MNKHKEELNKMSNDEFIELMALFLMCTDAKEEYYSSGEKTDNFRCGMSYPSWILKSLENKGYIIRHTISNSIVIRKKGMDLALNYFGKQEQQNDEVKNNEQEEIYYGL